MRILTCLVTHNRWGYTERCLESLQATVRKGDLLVIVDNASTDGSRHELDRRVPARHVLHNSENRFPGAACNQGWQHGLDYCDADLLHRSDNDIEYDPGWQDEVEAAYEQHPNLALLGLLNLHEDRGVQWPDAKRGDVESLGAVGGNTVMPRRLWDAGVRWQEGRWTPGMNEDGKMSHDALRYGEVAQLRRTIAHNMAYGRYSDHPGYYDRTAALRGIPDAEHSV